MHVAHIIIVVKEEDRLVGCQYQYKRVVAVVITIILPPRLVQRQILIRSLSFSFFIHPPSMNRKELAPPGSQHRRGRSLTGVVVARDTDENLDLFSRNRRTLSLASSDDSDGLIKLARVSVGSVKLSRTGMEDLLSSVDGGKNDYDWLLTPPGTPLLSDSSETQQNLAPRNSSSLRSVANSKSSRLSVTQMENSYPSRPTRSSSVTRTSIPSTNYNTYSNSNRSSSILNTSSASVTSISRSSTPNSRSTLTAGPRSSTPTSRVSSRPSTPVKSRPTPGSTFGEKTRAPPNHTRSSTPTSRPQTPTNVSSPALRSNSRPSTPTRRNPTQNPQVITGSSVSTGRIIANGRNSAPSSRGSSPGPRVRPPSQPIVPPNFPLDTPPNLRTTMPNRPVSAGRSRPSAPASVRVNPEPGLTTTPRRQSSPIVTRGRLPDPGKVRVHGNGHNINAMEGQKTPPVADPAARRPAKSTTSAESTGFGRTISKKSLDMALRHMDIRQGSGSIRASAGSTLFPQSIRPGAGKGHSARVSDIPVPIGSNGRAPVSSNGIILENGNCHNRFQDNEFAGHFSARVSESDMYESSRYDAILLKEDSKNTNWLVSDDKSEQGFMFDHRFESLPEPFDPL